MATDWSTNEVVAYTEHDGPGRPPAGPPTWIWYSTAGTLGVVFSTILFTDSLCPEHRAWVQTLASIAILGVILSITGLVRGWSAAPAITVVTAALGIAIGLIDMVHEPVRGAIVASLFGVAALTGTWLSVRQAPVRQWDRAMRRPTGRPAAAPEGIASPAGVAETEQPSPKPAASPAAPQRSASS
jgi:hypothetical protein